MNGVALYFKNGMNAVFLLRDVVFVYEDVTFDDIKEDLMSGKRIVKWDEVAWIKGVAIAHDDE